MKTWLVFQYLLLFTRSNLKLLRMNCTKLLLRPMRGCGAGMLVAGFSVAPRVDLRLLILIFNILLHPVTSLPILT